MEWRWFVIFFIRIFWHQQTWSFNIYSLPAFNWMCFVLVSYGPIRLVGEVWEYINVTYNKRFWKLLASPWNRWVDQLSFCPLQFGSTHFFCCDHCLDDICSNIWISAYVYLMYLFLCTFFLWEMLKTLLSHCTVVTLLISPWISHCFFFSKF